MSLTLHDKGWKSFGTGRMWRCDMTHKWLLETDSEGNTPSYVNLQPTVNKIRRIYSFYAGRVALGSLNTNGNGLDLLTANAMTESLGSVPSQLEYPDLLHRYQGSAARTTGERLGEIADFILLHEKYLVRKEPGYINPVQTPSRISVGSHHMLISTALEIAGPANGVNPEDRIAEMVLKLASQSIFAAEMAVKYLNRATGRHQNEPPLVAACYNAGSLRPDPSNPWNLRQYGTHIDRWIAFYNTSRLVNHPAGTAAVSS